jgi:hypothetical protein
MKKKILLCVLAVAILLLALPALAQKAESGPQPSADLLTESFTSATFPPTGWTSYDIDGGGTSWARNTTATYYHTSPASAGHNYSSAGMQDGWLVTPSLTIPAAGASLTFWEYTNYPGDLYKHSVLVCSSSCLPPTSPFTGWTEIFTYPTATAAWRQQTVDLTAYAGQAIYIAFRYEGDYADGWYIDDVAVTYPGPTLTYNSKIVVDDACGTLGGPGEHNGTGDPGETVTMDVVLNNTADPATGISSTLSTTTPGITVTQPTSAYPDIPAAGTGTNTTHFTYTIDQTEACQTTINFNLHVTATGGWVWDIPFTATVGSSIVDFAQNFDSGLTPPALPTGWLMQNIVGNGYWQTGNTYYCSAPNDLRYRWSTVGIPDSWVYTSPITLTAGITYQLNFNERAYSASYPEKLSVWAGTSQLNTDMTIPIMAETTITNAVCAPQAFTLTVPVTGTYYLGFHCTSALNMFYLVVDDIVLQHFVCSPCSTSCPTFSFTPVGPGLPAGHVGSSYSETITASNGTAPYTYAVTSGALPSGLTMDASGNITGTPDTSGVYNFTIKATDSLGCTGLISYTIEVCSTITVSPAALPGGYLGVAYSQTLTSTGGVSPYSYWISMGATPDGLTLASNGLLSGMPTTLGNYSFQAGSGDLWGCFGYQSYTVSICPVITLMPAALPDGHVGTAYSQTITASGGTGPYTYAVTAGTLTPGLSLASGGLLDGSPTAGGSYSFTVTATDANGCTGSKVCRIGIYADHCGLIAITAAGLGQDNTDWPSSHGLQTGRLTRDGAPSACSGKTCPGVYDTTPGRAFDSYQFSNPTCIDQCVQVTLDSACAIFSAAYLNFYDPANICTNYLGDPGTSPVSGTPVTFFFTIPAGDKAILVIHEVTAGGGCSTGYVLNIDGVPCSTSGEVGLQSAVIATDVCALGGAGNGDGYLDAGETASLAVTAGNIGELPLTNIAATLTSASSLITITQGSTTFPDIACGTALNNAPNFAFHLSGAAACGTVIPFTVHFTSDQGTWDRDFSITTTPAALSTMLNENFESWPLTGWIIGGAGPCLWDDNVLVGRANYTGAAGDCADADADKCGEAIDTTLATPAFSLAGVSTAKLEFNLAWFDYYGTSYGDVDITTDGGTNWTNLAELTPADTGIAGRATIDLTSFVGNPACQIQFHYITNAWELLWEVDDVTISGLDGALCAAHTCCPTIAIAPPTLPDGTAGTAYSQFMTASGGTAPYAYSLASGTLPAGLSLNPATGEISGTPTATGSSTFSILGSDANGCGGTLSYSILVSCPVVTPVITGDITNTCPSLTVPLSTGAYASYQWNDAVGPISGATTQNYTATVSGTYTVSVVDSYGCNGTSAPHVVTLHACGSPIVPYSVTPTTIITTNAGLDGTIAWDATNCPSTNYHIIYGKGENLSTWVVDGGVCGLGTSGTYAWSSIPDPSTYTSQLLWFIVVGDDGAGTEGSWGLMSDGNPRGGTTASGACGTFTTRDNSGTCATP